MAHFPIKARLLGLTAMALVTSPAAAQDYGFVASDPEPTSYDNPEGTTVEGARTGIYSTGGALTLENAGTIRGNGTNQAFGTSDGGVVITGAGADIFNAGTISGNRFGITTDYVDIAGTPTGFAKGTVLLNTGFIIGDTNDGVRLIGGSTVTNLGYIAGRVGAGADGISIFPYDDQDVSAITSFSSVTNVIGATIEGNRYGVILSAGGSVDNAGTISGNTGGITIQSQLIHPGKIGTVTNSGTVNGQVGFFGLASATLTNSGTITAAVGPAVNTNGTLTIDNQVGGTITGASSGILSTAGTLTLDNVGTIRGNGTSAAFGNSNGGVVVSGGTAIIDNAGTISGAQFGVTTDSRTTGATLTGAIGSSLNNTGFIIGDNNDGVRLIGGGTVTNAGYIAGRVGAGADGISMFAYDDQTVAPGAQIGSITNFVGATIEGNRFGIILGNGGTVTNAGTITGSNRAILLQAGLSDPGRVGTISNTGTINGGVSDFGLASFNISNGPGGSITAATDGVYGAGSTLTLNNAGTIRGNGTTGGVTFSNGGVVLTGGPANITNGGTISGASFGITTLPYGGTQGRAIGSTITNTGFIIGDNNDGVRLIGGGTVTNAGYIAGRVGTGADGISMFAYDDQTVAPGAQIGSITNFVGATIEGNRFGIILGNGGTVTNAGTITGFSGAVGQNTGGVHIQALPGDPGRTGSVTNSGTINGGVSFFGLASSSLTNSGTISSNGLAVVSNSATSFVNSGTIAAVGGTAVQLSDFADTATLQAGSSITGAVDGAGGYDTAILSGTSATVTALQTAAQFSNFEQLTVESGYWSAAAAIGTFESIAVDGGTLQLTGSLTGDVTVGAAGSFTIGDGGTTGTFSGDLVNDGQFTFNRSDDLSFAGDFSGTGSFTKLGAGTLTFTGDYGFTGTTSLLAGGLVIGGALDPETEFNLTGGTLQLSGDQTIAGLSGTGGELVLTNGGTLLVDQAGDTQFAGSISGDGSLIKDGAGYLNLTGNHTYTGATTINAGVLAVNGSITSDVTINSGATLGGTGTTGDVTINAGGIFNPGNSIGTIAVAGNLSFGSGSVYRVETNPAGGSDRINASGSVNIASGASVQVLAGTGNYSAQTQYTILTAGGSVTGKFGSVTSNLAFLTPKLTHKSSSVTLLLVRNGKSFGSTSLTGDAGAAAAIEGLGASSYLYNSILNQSVSGAQQAFSALSGSSFADLGATLADGLGRIELGLASAGDAAPSLAWADSSLQSAPGARAASTFKVGGGVAMVVAGTRNQSLVTGTIQGEASTRYAGAAFALRSGDLQVGGGIVQGFHDLSVSRSIRFPSFADRTQASFQVNSLQLQAEASYSLASGASALSPYANVSHVRLSSDRFSEEGGVATLSFEADRRSLGRLSIGARATTRIALGDALTVVPRIDASVQQAWGDLDGGRAARFASGSSTFETVGEGIDRHSAVIDAGLDVTLDALSLSAGYRGRFSKNQPAHSAQVSASLRF